MVDDKARFERLQEFQKSMNVSTCSRCGGLIQYVPAPPIPTRHTGGAWSGWFHLDKTREHFESVGWYDLDEERS